MKKLKFFAIVLMAGLIAGLSSACTRIVPLDAPKGFVLDDNYTLYWGYVPGARSYTVRIENADGHGEEDVTARFTHVSLAYLAEGDYEIRVMAVGGSENEIVSAWSETVEFHRDRESGLVFTAINGNTEYAVTQVGTASGAVTVESVYRGKPVTEIAEDAFRGRGSSRVETVVIGEGVKTIGNNAFYNCTNLTEVQIPDTVTRIGTNLFQGCTKLAQVNLPEGITSIPDYTFAYCRALETFTIGSNVTFIGESAFYNCSALTEAEIPDAVSYIGPHAFDSDKALERLSVGKGITSVGDYAFYACSALSEVLFAEIEGQLTLGDHVFDGCLGIEAIELPEGLTNVGAYDFYRCSALSDVRIPESVTSVGAFAFRETAFYDAQSASGDGFIYADRWLVAATDECKLSLTVLTGDMLRADVVGIADQTFIVNMPTESGGVVTTGAPFLEEVSLAASIRYLGVYAFYRCPQLNKFTTEAGSELVSVGDRAFQNCSILRNVQFRNGLKEIGSYAFYNCTMITGGDNLVPASVERIGTYAFWGTGLWLQAAETDGVVYAGNWVVGFNNLVDTAIVFKNGTVGISDFAFYQNEDVQNITGLAGAEHIGRGAFYGCSSLSLISLNYNLTEIADNTFSGCTSLFLANLPYNLKRIGLRAFYQCTMLDAIDLSVTDVETVGDYAFYGCFNVKNITLGSKLEDIGDYAFYGLDQIAELEIPGSVKEIGSHAFANCSALATVIFGENLEKIGTAAFMGCETLSGVTLPDSVKEVGNYAFYRCTSLVELDLGDGVEKIGTYAFARSGLTSLILPASVTKVGNYAFKGCTALESVLMLGVPLEIGAHAFYGGFPTIYVAGDIAETTGWNSRWNSSFRPVVWNCATEEGGLVSFVNDPANVTNPFARGGFSAPARKGYDFVGWATSPGGEAVYGENEWQNAEQGVTLYAVWTAQRSDVPSAPDTTNS